MSTPNPGQMVAQAYYLANTPSPRLYPLECYRCGKAGDASEFPLPRQCPDCGSFEVHHPSAGTLIKPSQKDS